MHLSSISLRSLKYEHKRYTLLFIAATLGIALALTVIGLLSGMMNSLHNKARIYYGGDVMLFHNNGGVFGWKNFENTLLLTDKICKENDLICSPRLDFDNSGTFFIFEGTSIQQRKIKGVDFAREESLLNTLTFTEGSPKNIANTNGVLISQAVASNLNVRVGDNITILLKTTQNYTNTSTLVVKGIFHDTSLFGASIAYIDIDYLREIQNIPLEFCHTIGLYDLDNNFNKREIEKLQKEFSQYYQMFKIVDDKSDYINCMSTTAMDKYALISLDANLQDINFLISAMHLIIYMIITVLVIIIAIGIGSTYKVIVVKRTNEIGMYMALGMTSIRIIGLFLMEVFYLLLASFITAIFVCLLFSNLIKLFDFSVIPSFDIFLTNGLLLVQPTILQFITIFGIVLVTTLVLVYFTIKKYIDINPVDALNVAE